MQSGIKQIEVQKVFHQQSYTEVKILQNNNIWPKLKRTVIDTKTLYCQLAKSFLFL